MIDAILVLHSEIEQGIQEGIREEMGLEAQIEQFRIFGIEIMLF